MSELPGGKEIGAYVGSVLIAIGGAFSIWKVQSRTKLEVTENSSRGDWIKHIEEQCESALKREHRALEREQVALEKVSTMAVKIAFLTEKTERQERKLDYLIRLVSRERPDLADALRSSFGEL